MRVRASAEVLPCSSPRTGRSRAPRTPPTAAPACAQRPGSGSTMTKEPSRGPDPELDRDRHHGRPGKHPGRRPDDGHGDPRLRPLRRSDRRHGPHLRRRTRPAAAADNYGYGIPEAQTREQNLRARTARACSLRRAGGGHRRSCCSHRPPGQPAATARLCRVFTTKDLHRRDRHEHGLLRTRRRGHGSRRGDASFYLCPSQTAGSQPVMQGVLPAGLAGRGATEEGRRAGDELALGQDRFKIAPAARAPTPAPEPLAPGRSGRRTGPNIQGPTQLVDARRATPDVRFPRAQAGPTSMPATLVNGDDNNGNGGLLATPSPRSRSCRTRLRTEVFLNGLRPSPRRARS